MYCLNQHKKQISASGKISVWSFLLWLGTFNFLVRSILKYMFFSDLESVKQKVSIFTSFQLNSIASDFLKISIKIGDEEVLQHTIFLALHFFNVPFSKLFYISHLCKRSFVIWTFYKRSKRKNPHLFFPFDDCVIHVVTLRKHKEMPHLLYAPD